jgi:hypothetical protein
MTFVFANNVITTLTADAVGTTLSVASVAGIPVIPTGQVLALTIIHQATAGVFEIVYVSAVAGLNLTVLRGQEGTATTPWVAGDTIFSAVTSGMLQSVSSPQFQFGDLKPSALGIEGLGWRLCNGQTRPQTDPFWSFIVAQSLTSSWKPGYTGSTTYNMPNAQDVVLVGQDTMGGASSPGLLTNAVAGFDPTVLLNIGGNQAQQAHVHGVTDPGHSHSSDAIAPSSTADGALVIYELGDLSSKFVKAATINSAFTGLTVNSVGAGSSQNIQPSMVVAILMYVGA